MFKLYLSRIKSPGRFRVQNLIVWSLEPEQSIWPNGCQASVQTILSCAVSTQPISLSVLQKQTLIYLIKNLCLLATYPTFQKSMEPSEPPEQKRPSCIGCHDTELASFLWPRKTCISSRKLRKSKSLSKWSRDAVTSQLPLSFHFKSITVDLCACLHERNIIKMHWKRVFAVYRQLTYSVANALPLFGSHNFIGCWLSLLPDTIRPFCGCQCTHLTSAPWPGSSNNYK